VEPVVSIALAAVVLGERLGPLQLVGGAVVLLAVGTLARLRPLEDETVVPA
jgi:drug/metabolite transporter (DMT)-like permease